MNSTRSIKCEGHSKILPRWAHNPKVVGSNPTPATPADVAGDFKRAEGCARLYAHCAFRATSHKMTRSSRGVSSSPSSARSHHRIASHSLVEPLCEQVIG